MIHLESADLEKGLGADFSKSHRQIRALGCFILDDCLGADLIDDCHKAFVSLFELSDEEKRKYFVDKKEDPLGHGFSPFGVSKAIDTGIPNLLETWDISPEKYNWPESLGEEWKTIRSFQKELREASILGLRVFANLIGVNADQLLNLIDIESIEGIHLIHYFPIMKYHEVEARRQSKHSDNTLITLIPPPFPINTGLTVFDRSKRAWMDVVVENGSCLVQAGLLLEYITCGAIKANLHTVSNPKIDSKENVSRYSSPFFCSPKRGTQVRVLDKFRDQCENDPVTIEQLEKEYFGDIF